MIKLKSLLEVLKDKDGKHRTDLKYSSSGTGKSFSPPVDTIVSVTGSALPNVIGESIVLFAIS